MTAQTQDQGIQKYARIAKTTLHIGFTVAAVAIAATTIYAAAKGVALSSTFLAYLANPWAIAIIVSVAAVYLLIGAYQQLCLTEGAKGQDGPQGKPGKDADFSVLLGDAIIKSGTISVTEELFLVLPIDDYKALIGNDKKEVHVLLAGKKVELEHKDPVADAKEYKVKVTKVGEKDQLADMKAELGMAEGATSLKVAVSNKDYEALKSDVPAKLANVAIEGAVKKAIA